jgi:hypothetical protein
VAAAGDDERRTGDKPLALLAELIPTNRYLRFSSIIAQLNQDWNVVIETARELLKDQTVPGVIRSECLGRLAIALIREERYEEMATLLAHTFANTPDLLGGLHVHELYEMCQEQTELKNSLDPVWPVVAYIVTRVLGVSDAEKALFPPYLYLLQNLAVDRPSHLRGRLSEFDPTVLALFLEHVCVLDVMDSDQIFTGTGDLESERIEICQVLLTLNPDRQSYYVDEISRLQQRAAIREGIRHIEQSKVHVDTKGIRESLGESFTERFNHYHRSAQTRTEKRNINDKSNNWRKDGIGSRRCEF